MTSFSCERHHPKEDHLGSSQQGTHERHTYKWPWNPSHALWVSGFSIPSVFVFLRKTLWEGDFFFFFLQLLMWDVLHQGFTAEFIFLIPNSLIFSSWLLSVSVLKSELILDTHSTIYVWIKSIIWEFCLTGIWKTNEQQTSFKKLSARSFTSYFLVFWYCF